MKDLINVKLSDLGDGSLQEKFEVSLKKVIENVLDPNTDESKKRSITIKLEFQPDEYREICGVSMSLKETLVPHEATTTRIAIDRDFGDETIQAIEMKSREKGQTRMNFDRGKIETDIGQDVEELEKADDATDQEDDVQEESQKEQKILKFN